MCSWSCQLHLPGPGQTVRALTGLPNNPTQATGRALSHRGSYIDYLITFGGPERPPKTTECTCISHVYLCGCIYVGRGEWYFWWARRPLLTSPSRLPLCAFSQHLSLSLFIYFYPLYLMNPQVRMIAFFWMILLWEWTKNLGFVGRFVKRKILPHYCCFPWSYEKWI